MQRRNIPGSYLGWSQPGTLAFGWDFKKTGLLKGLPFKINPGDGLKNNHSVLTFINPCSEEIIPQIKENVGKI